MASPFPSFCSASSSSSSAAIAPQQVVPKKTNYIPLSYNPHNSQGSATHLVLTLFPDWEAKDIEFVRFTDGITNTLLKCVNSTKDQDKDAVLLRAYGRETGILIDRERECTSHALLSSYSLAPPLLARFNNGLLYRYVAGRVCAVTDLSTPPVYRAVANRLGEWHGVLPVSSRRPPSQPTDVAGRAVWTTENSLWGVLRRWTEALPCETVDQERRKTELLGELAFLETESGLKGMDGGVGNVFGHCDLLNGNVIILPEGTDEGERKDEELGLRVPGGRKVHFIDYEYATPCERAFDISNHFAEWGGFACDYNFLPTRSARRDFMHTYLRSYHAHKRSGVTVTDAEVEALMKEVDAFRGIPGFYWGIWALIQDTISQIDFDYGAYAEVRLGEYFAWKKTVMGTPAEEEICLRESRWATE